MLDNWTVDELFNKFCTYDMEVVARDYGRLAIVDNEEVEKLWDQFVQARTELMSRFNTWERDQ